MAKIEREYVVPLRRGFAETPRYKRAKKAVTLLKEYLARHTKADEIKIGQHLNEALWARGIKHPPGHVKVTASIEEIEGVKIAKVELFGKAFKESVRPEEKKEEQGGIAGKVKSMLGGDKDEKEPAVEEPDKAPGPKAEAKTVPKKPAPAKKKE